MSERPANPRSEHLSTLVRATMAFVILIVFLLPPVKQWLNADPVRLRIIYPLMALICAYGLFQAYQSSGRTFDLARWGVILLAAVCMVLAVYGVGPVFFTIGKACAIGFIVMEIGRILYEGLVVVRR